MAISRKLSVPAAPMTAGSSDWMLNVPCGPLSPDDTTTVTPAATAASLAWRTDAPPPNDSEMTSACVVITVASIPAMTCDVDRTGVSMPVRSTSDASGASPLMMNVQLAGIGRVEFGSALAYWYTTVPCATIDEASP